MRGAMTAVEHGLPRGGRHVRDGRRRRAHAEPLDARRRSSWPRAACPSPSTATARSRAAAAAPTWSRRSGIPIDVPAARQGERAARGRASRSSSRPRTTRRSSTPPRRGASSGCAPSSTRSGPLANPARATHQLVGVYDDALRAVVARALGRLGSQRAWVVRSEDGLDEVSPCAPTRVSELAAGGDVRERRGHARGLRARSGAPRSAIAGGDAAGNARRHPRHPRGRTAPGAGRGGPQRRGGARRRDREEPARVRRRARAASDRRRRRAGDPRALERGAPRERATGRGAVSLLEDILATQARRGRRSSARSRDRAAPRAPSTSRRPCDAACRRAPAAHRRGEAAEPERGASLARARAGRARAGVRARRAPRWSASSATGRFFDGCWERPRGGPRPPRRRRARASRSWRRSSCSTSVQLDEAARPRRGRGPPHRAHREPSATLVGARARSARRGPRAARRGRRRGGARRGARGRRARRRGQRARPRHAGDGRGARGARARRRSRATRSPCTSRASRARADVARLARDRADAALVGEALMRQDDPRPLLASMVREAVVRRRAPGLAWPQTSLAGRRGPTLRRPWTSTAGSTPTSTTFASSARSPGTRSTPTRATSTRWRRTSAATLRRRRRSAPEAIASLMVANVERGFGARSSARQLSALRGFFRFLVRERAVPRTRRRSSTARSSTRKLPRVLSFEEVERLLGGPRHDDRPRACCHAAMLHLMYASGLRVSELVRPSPRATSTLQRGLVSALGKGGKRRLVPVGEVALDHLDALPARRPARAGAPRATSTLFVRRAAGRFTREGFWRIVRRYAAGAGHRAPALAAQAPALVRDPPPARRRRPPRGAGDARPRRPRDDRDLHARRPGPRARRAREVASAGVNGKSAKFGP